MSDASPSKEAASAPGPHLSTKKTSRPALRLAIVGIVVGAAVAFLLIKGLGSSLNYFDTVNDAVTHRASIGTSEIRLEGTVDKGTVVRTNLGASFYISSGTHRVYVINEGTPPSLFQPTVPVVVVGHFSTPTSMTFLSNQIMVKHSSSYITQHPNRVRAGNGATH